MQIGPYELNKVHVGDCLKSLECLPDGCIQTCITSPPYWGLRDYGVKGQVGLENEPQKYVNKMVEIFRQIKRVLRPDGTVWLNLGDCYSGSGKGDGVSTRKQATNRGSIFESELEGIVPSGLKPKDLIGIPWMVAFALRADGWYLRSDIIWNKPNSMPESVKDRPTRSHEYIFLLSKSDKYYYDLEAIKETCKSPLRTRTKNNGESTIDMKKRGYNSCCGMKIKRHKRDVWTVPTHSYHGAHFATYPLALIEPCILAGTSEKGCCSACGTPIRRILKKVGESAQKWSGLKDIQIEERFGQVGSSSIMKTQMVSVFETAGWKAACSCNAEARPCVVLDPFAGSGTTGVAALKLGRNFIGFDLNTTYVNELANPRLEAARRGLTLRELKAGQTTFSDI